MDDQSVCSVVVTVVCVCVCGGGPMCVVVTVLVVDQYVCLVVVDQC